MWLKDTYNFERKQLLIRLDFKICQKGRFKRLPEKKSEKTWFIVIQGFSFNITLYSSSLPVHVPFISDILYLKASWLISIQGCFFFLFCSFQLYNKPFIWSRLYISASQLSNSVNIITRMKELIIIIITSDVCEISEWIK